MTNAFVRKLRASGSLSRDDEQRLEAACFQTRSFLGGADLIQERDEPGPVFVILEGWAIRYKILPDGTRQVISFVMPGDFCDVHVGVLREMDHSLGTLTRGTLATIQRPAMEALIVSSPGITRAFWWVQLVELAILRETIVSIGRRTAKERIAHLLCELCLRMQQSGVDRQHSYRMPFNQHVLADAVGITPVHVNRTVMALRKSGALDVNASSILISDLTKLSRIAGFDDNYLVRSSKAQPT